MNVCKCSLHGNEERFWSINHSENLLNTANRWRVIELVDWQMFSFNYIKVQEYGRISVFICVFGWVLYYSISCLRLAFNLSELIPSINLSDTFQTNWMNEEEKAILLMQCLAIQLFLATMLSWSWLNSILVRLVMKRHKHLYALREMWKIWTIIISKRLSMFVIINIVVQANAYHWKEWVSENRNRAKIKREAIWFCSLKFWLDWS